MEINTGDTAWVLAATALVVLMTPALGFFYGGLVRQKNVLSTIMHSFFILCLISVVWTSGDSRSPSVMATASSAISTSSACGILTATLAYNAPTIPGAAFVIFQ